MASVIDPALLLLDADNRLRLPHFSRFSGLSDNFTHFVLLRFSPTHVYVVVVFFTLRCTRRVADLYSCITVRAVADLYSCSTVRDVADVRLSQFEVSMFGNSSNLHQCIKLYSVAVSSLSPPALHYIMDDS